jgi:hypothetical protein
LFWYLISLIFLIFLISNIPNICSKSIIEGYVWEPEVVGAITKEIKDKKGIYY